MAAKLPAAILWLANPVLSQVRANQLELKKGASDSGSGGAIRMFQEALIYWGSQIRKPAVNLLTQHGADGTFGSETKSALVLFQKENRDKTGKQLNDDGILGDLTLGALDKIVTAPSSSPAPAPLPVDNNEWLSFTVDVIAFNDGPEIHHANQMFPVANEVFKRMNMTAAPGKILRGWSSHDAPLVDKIARNVFEINQPGRKNGGGTSSVITETTAIGRSLSDEVDRLHRWIHPRRITACLVAQFPQGVQEAMGVTFTTEAFKRAPIVFVARSYDCVDVFWHEIGHALLNTGIDHEDHASGTIMTRKAEPASRNLEIRDDQRLAMRAMARTLR